MRANRTLAVAISVIALMVSGAHGQGQPGGRGGAPGAPVAGRGGGGPAMTSPKPVIPNAKPVRSCESLATVALPNTTIESAAVDPANPGVCRVTAVTTHPPPRRQGPDLGRDTDVELERPLSRNRRRRIFGRQRRKRQSAGGCRLCVRCDRYGARGRERQLCAGRERAAELAAHPRQRAPRHSRNDRHRQGADAGDVRRRAAVFLLQRVLHRRPAGTDGGAALPAGLQRHRVGCAGDQLEPVQQSASLGSGRDERGRQSGGRLQAHRGNGGRDRRLRRHRWREGRRHRRSETLQLRSEAARRHVRRRLRCVHGRRCERDPQAVGRPPPRGWQLPLVRPAAWSGFERAVDQPGYSASPATVQHLDGLVSLFPDAGPEVRRQHRHRPPHTNASGINRWSSTGSSSERTIPT